MRAEKVTAQGEDVGEGIVTARRGGAAGRVASGAALLRQALPSHLISARAHGTLLAHRRMHFVAERLRIASVFLALVTVAWIPVDALLFAGDWSVVGPLGWGRLLTAALFLIIGCGALRHVPERFGVRAIGLMLAVGIAFFLFAHAVIGASGRVHIESAGHAQYLLLPIALAAGLSIFPLTLIEAVLLTAVPLLALIAETLHSDGGAILSQAGVAVGLMLSIMLTTATCSVSQLQLLHDLHEHSTVDPLTGALSRRAGNELLGIMAARARRSDRALSLMLIDLDRFKAVNDTFGHDAGDRVLREAAQAMKRRLRRRDALIRWGGEEFVLVLPDTSAAQAAELLGALCGSGLARRPEGTMQTASVGLAERRADGAADWHRLVEIADARMYDAKKNGRDQLHGPDGVVRFSAGLPAVEAPGLAMPDIRMHELEAAD